MIRNTTASCPCKNAMFMALVPGALALSGFLCPEPGARNPREHLCLKDNVESSRARLSFSPILLATSLGVLLVFDMGSAVVVLLLLSENLLLEPIEVVYLVLGISSILAAKYLPSSTATTWSFRKKGTASTEVNTERDGWPGEEHPGSRSVNDERRPATR
jgi:hypothetical protein